MGRHSAHGCQSAIEHHRIRQFVENALDGAGALDRPDLGTTGRAEAARNAGDFYSFWPGADFLSGPSRAKAHAKRDRPPAQALASTRREIVRRRNPSPRYRSLRARRSGAKI